MGRGRVSSVVERLRRWRGMDFRTVTRSAFNVVSGSLRPGR